MGFKKSSFVISMIPAASQSFEIRVGWIDEELGVGFFKENQRRWIATDLASGMFITAQPTRVNCVEWIRANKDKIGLVKSYPRYVQAVKSLYSYCKKELMIVGE